MGLDICLSWHNFTVNCLEKKNIICGKSKRKKIILNDVSGSCCSGSLVAIMGSSGSGKTTLLGAISGRLLEKSGILKINDQIVDDDTIRGISAYIPQKYIFTDILTVMEHLKFQTALKTRDYTDEFIRRLMTDFSLNKDTMINCLSGGERRKLALATELINNPSIIFCDEITTGLDSYSAISVVNKLLELSMNGKIVIMTVHQPSSQLYQYFTHLLLLSNAHLVFQGTKDEAEEFFLKQNFKCPVNYNPSDFYIKCLNDPNLISSQNKDTQKSHRQDLHLQKDMKFKKSFVFQLKWLLWRAYIDSLRNLNRFKASYTILVITACILGTSYANVDITDIDGVQNIQGALLFIISELIFSHMYYVIFIFPSEVSIFLSEKHLYTPLPYFLSKLISTVPYCFINTFSYVALYFVFMRFLHGFGYFIGMFYLLFVATMAATAFGLCLSALFPTVEYIDLFIVPLEVLVMSLSGMWIKIDTVPKIFAILKYVSPFYYTFECMSVMQWNTIDSIRNCTEGTICFDSGKDVLKHFAFGGETDAKYDLVYLHLLIIVYSVIGYLCLVKKRKLFYVY